MLSILKAKFNENKFDKGSGANKKNPLELIPTDLYSIKSIKQ